MSYEPKPGSKAAAAVEYVLKHGTARSKDIAQAVGVESSSIMAMLHAAVENGVLVACDVAVPGAKPQKEYRVSAGGKPAPFTIGRASLPPRAPVAAEAAPPAEKPARKPQRATAEVQRRTAKPPQIIPENIPAGTEYVAASTFRCGLFSSGHLELILRDGSRVELPPEDARSLCDYLDRTLAQAAA